VTIGTLALAGVTKTASPTMSRRTVADLAIRPPNQKRPQLHIHLEGALQGELAEVTGFWENGQAMVTAMEPRSLTPSQTAEVLGVSTRTLRRYSSILSNSLSEPASKRGQKRFYNSQDVETLRRAQRMMRGGMTLKNISEVLPIQPAGDVPDSALMVGTETAMIVGANQERVQIIFEEITEHDDRLKRLEDWSKLPWWKKITSSPE